MTATYTTLSELAEVLVGYPFASKRYAATGRGHRLLRGDNIGQGVVRWENAVWWDHDADARYELQVGDLVLAMDRPWIGAGLKFASLREEDTPALLVQRVARLRAREGVDQRYLHYLIGSKEFTDYVLAVQTGTAVPHISGAQIQGFRAPKHSPLEQKAIGEVLGALDDKIATNERVVRLSDELSSAHFHAAAAGGDEVPLSSLARFVNGRAYTKDATGTGRVVVRIAELNSGIGGSTVWNDIDVPDDNTARPGDLLFAWSGSLTAARWYRPEAIVNQHIFKVIPNAGTPMWLVNQAVHEKLAEFKAIAADKATTMGHIQRHHLDEPVRIPPPSEVKRLDDLMTSLWQTALTAEVENLKLAEARDELLPLLMSGKVRFKDAEKIVEGELRW
ncbi:hypothetical protein M6B22_16915 [Jatrophihabitans cynanchi]|uniref:Type I restriction modification DNA specificity domain-containing protein n=1 Tax=Jatrophihabitans cynanchi TaxID=2944128 RepID=A0ABY7JYH4_9ACTN|nr:hypothetical protein [Jatrophihabitans sp. SB3-54]WAX56204.1 hypothetical protein M6B22_16915 [Jatrophihabitans sp. SB3-54]